MPIYKITNPDNGEAVQVWSDSQENAIKKFQSETRAPKTFRIKDPRSDVPQDITAFDAKDAIKISQNMPETGLATQFVAGANVGASNVMGLPVDLVTGGINKVGGYFGMDPIENPVGGSEFFKNIMEAPQDLRGRQRLSDIAPTTKSERFARKVGEYVGGSAVPAAGLASRTQNIGRNLAGEAIASTSGGLAEQGLVEVTNGKAPHWARTLAGMTGAFSPFGALKIIKGMFDPSKQLQEIINQGNLQAGKMKNVASDIYTSIEENKSIVAPSKNADEFIKELSPVFEKKGWMRTKTNNLTGSQTTDIDSKYTIAKGVWEKISERFYQRNLSGADMMADWRLLNDASRQAKKAASMGSASGTESKIIGEMIKKYEEKFGSYLGQDFKTANSLYRSASNAEELSTALDLASINFNKLNANEYKQLQNKLSQFAAREIKKGKASSFSSQEIKAIRDAAKTSKLEDFAMWVGNVRKIVGLPGVAVSGGAAYTGLIDPLSAAAVGATAVGVGSGAQAIARGAQRRDISNMISEILGNPKMSQEGKNKLLNALSVYLGPSSESAIKEAQQSLPEMP